MRTGFCVGCAAPIESPASTGRPHKRCPACKVVRHREVKRVANKAWTDRRARDEERLERRRVKPAPQKPAWKRAGGTVWVPWRILSAINYLAKERGVRPWQVVEEVFGWQEGGSGVSDPPPGGRYPVNIDPMPNVFVKDVVAKVETDTTSIESVGSIDIDPDRATHRVDIINNPPHVLTLPEACDIDFIGIAERAA